jgi:hypothetical protein
MLHPPACPPARARGVREWERANERMPLNPVLNCVAW